VARSPRHLLLLIGAVLALGSLALQPAPAAEPQFPPLTGRVVDEAGVLSSAARDRITGWLEQFEAATKRQVVVATVKSLQGLPIEDYGYRLGRAWGIGEKGKNTGAILLVAPTEHKVRIEVGYGLEGELTDAISKTIIDEDILPSFRQGNYEAGILAGTAAILRALGWNGASAAIPTHPAPSRNSGGVVPLIFFVLMMGFVIWRITRSIRGYHGSGLGMFMLGTALGSSGGSSSSSFGGGFSGGGGSFGGGGASGSW
jgi:uncharacterized protein